MCDPKTLEAFIAWGVKKFPAQRTALILSDHGSAYYGFGHEETRNTMLRLNALGTALERGLKGAALPRFDLIAFDCCLMASLEVMRACQPYAKIMMGFEEVSFGLNFEHCLPALADNPRMSAEDFAKVAATWAVAYSQFFREAKTGVSLGKRATLSVVDLTRIPAAIQALDRLADALTGQMKKEGRDAFLRVARARNEAEEYGKVGNHAYHLRDLHHFARSLKGSGLDDLCEELMAAIDSAVVFRIGGKERQFSHGISLFFPPDQTSYTQKVVAKDKTDLYEKAWSCSPKWTQFLKSYLALAGEDKEKPDVSDTRTAKSEYKVGEQVQVRTKVKAKDIAEAHFFLGLPLSNKETQIFGLYPVKPDRIGEECEFDGTWPAIGTPKKKLRLWVCALSYEQIGDEGGRKYALGVPVMYRESEDQEEEKQISLSFNVEFDQKWKMKSGKFAGAFENTEGGPDPVELASGGVIRTVYLFLKESGETDLRPSKETLTLGDDPMTIVELPLPTGREYTLGYIVKDLSGNQSFDSTKIKLVK